MCVDVQVKGFVMCLAVCESGRHWVVGLCLGCVCVACCQQGGWATGGAWSSKPFRRPSLLSFFLLTHQCSFSYCVFSFVHFISMEWCIGLNLSYPFIFIFFTFHLSVLLHTTAFFSHILDSKNHSHTHIHTHIHILANTLSLINTSYFMESTPHNCPEFEI